MNDNTVESNEEEDVLVSAIVVAELLLLEVEVEAPPVVVTSVEALELAGGWEMLGRLVLLAVDVVVSCCTEDTDETVVTLEEDGEAVFGPDEGC